MKHHGTVLVTKPSEQILNQRQFYAYRDHRLKFADWLWHLGKDPERGEGYAKATVKMRAHRLDKFYRWVWETDGYYVDPRDITTTHADDWMKHLANTDYSLSYKTDLQKALKTLFKWQGWKRGEPVEGDPVITYQDPTHNQHPRDYLTLKERKQIRAAALEYSSTPPHDQLSKEERDVWNRKLALRLGKPANKITKADWDQANSWKIPSLVWTSLDAGFRPVEVRRARR